MAPQDQEYAGAIPDLVRSTVGPGMSVREVRRIAGGASRQTWYVRAARGPAEQELVVRVEAGGSARPGALSLAHEAMVMEAARAAGVSTPPVIGYDATIIGRPALLMPLIGGESRGNRIVAHERFARARARLPVQLADEFARIHSIDLGAVPFLPRRENAQTVTELLRTELLEMPGVYPTLHYVLEALRESPPVANQPVVCHGDLRVGNVLVDTERGLTSILDWELAHVGDPLEDLTWPIVRQWRFGNPALRLGGVADPEVFWERYTTATGREFSAKQLLRWEIIGNVKWALGCLSQARRHLDHIDRSIEYALLGRLACEPAFEALWLSRNLGQDQPEDPAAPRAEALDGG